MGLKHYLEDVAMIILVGVFILVLLGGCTKAYKVCDQQGCRSMSSKQAIEAAEVHKEWGEGSKLSLRINKDVL